MFYLNKPVTLEVVQGFTDRMRPTTGSSAGYPEEEAFDDTEDYHDKRHADGVNTLQAQQDLSDILYKVIARACERERAS